MYLVLAQIILASMVKLVAFMAQLSNKVDLHYICIYFCGSEVHCHHRRSEKKLWILIQTFRENWLSILKVSMLVNFLTGSMDEVEAQIESNKCDRNYKDPVQTLPEAPPPLCNTPGDNCEQCSDLKD